MYPVRTSGPQGRLIIFVMRADTGSQGGWSDSRPARWAADAHNGEPVTAPEYRPDLNDGRMPLHFSTP